MKSLVFGLCSVILFFGNGFCSSQILRHSSDRPPALRVAVIGGGISGASVIHYLNELHPYPFPSIDIYEKNNRFGGRMDDVTLWGYRLESGASMMISDNQYVWNLSEQFNLTRVRMGAESHNSNGSILGVWDDINRRFLFQSKANKMFGIGYMHWHFGVKAMMDLWLLANYYVQSGAQYYSFQNRNGVFTKTDEFWRLMDGYDATQNDCLSYLYKTLFPTDEIPMDPTLIHPLLNELVLGLNRNNYNQNLDTNGLVCMTGVAALVGKAWYIREGNSRLPNAMLKHALESDQMHLSSTVVSITKRYYQKSNPTKSSTAVENRPPNQTHSYFVKTADGNTDEFDRIVIATPLSNANIEFKGWNDDSPFVTDELPSAKRVIYKRVHTTFVTGILNPSYFEMDTSQLNRLRMILVGNVADKSPKFNSVGRLVRLRCDANNVTSKFAKLCAQQSNDDRQWNVYKFFSDNSLSESDLNEMFLDWDRDTLTEAVWDAYPKYVGAAEFPPIIMDNGGIYFCNSVESGTSAIEVMITNGRNIALLLSKEIKQMSQNKSKRNKKAKKDATKREL